MKRIFFSLLCLFISINVIQAKDVEFMECKYSDEYIKWDKLPENKKTQMSKPNMCEINFPSNLYLKGSSTDSYFNLAEQGKITSVKHQEDTNTCWAFSALASIESNVLMNNGPTLDLSEAHLELAYQQDFQMGYPTYKRVIGQGGNAYISSSYILNGRGPVLESSYSFSKLLSIRNDHKNFNLSQYISVKPYLNVGASYLYYGDNSQVSNKCSTNDINKIKKTLVNYGAVTTRLYMANDYLDQTTGAYYYNGNSNSNHAVTIVGWNDNYNFTDKNMKSKPSTKGAWIIKNSYGTSKFDKGYNYISYETKDICSVINWYDNVSIIDSSKNFNNYYYDELFYNSAIVTKSNSAYLGTIYSKKSEKIEKLKQVKFASHKPGYNYKIYFSDNANFSNTTLVGSGTIKESGYTSVDVTKDINITSSKYSIIVVLTNDIDSNGITIPLVAKTDSDESYSNVNITSGVNYIGTYSSPALWADITKNYQAMLAIKAVTEVTNQSEVIEPETPSVPDEPTVEPEVPSVPDEPVVEPEVPNVPDEPIVEPEVPNVPDEPIVEPEVPNVPDEPIVEPEVPNVPDDPIVEPETPSEKPEYDDGEKKEPNSSNNQVVIKPNKDNDISYIEKTPEDVDNPKTGDINSMLIFIIIMLIFGILITGIKKLKKYNKM